MQAPQLLNDSTRRGRDAIRLPHKFKAREYQMDLFRAAVPAAFGLDRPPARRIVLPWHRRAGKDKCAINLLVMFGMQEVGNYLYMSPEISQTRKIIWQGIDADGFRFIDHIPKALIKRKTEADMLIELINGSTIQLGGADAYDRNMGTNPKAIIFSEYSIMNPIAWNYYRPILVENGGTAVFIFTARGHNHAYDLYKTAVERTEAKDPNWYLSLKTVADTKRDDGTPVISQQDIEQEIAEGMPQEMVDQEFYCSFDAGQVGAYYADQIADLRKRDRIGDFPWVPTLPVNTAWDFGLNDKNVVWYYQNVMGTCRVIDYDEDTGVPLNAWIKHVAEKPYVYQRHIAPHDIEHREQFTGKTRKEQAEEMGFFFESQDKLPVQEGINAVRSMLPMCVFNEGPCQQGIDGLMNYTKVYDEKLQNFRDKPAHDWASHPADGFRALALGWYDDSPATLDDQEKPRVLRAMGRERGYWRRGESRSRVGRGFARNPDARWATRRKRNR